MLKIYLDNCCYNRLFDDFDIPKNNLEAQAVNVILKKYDNDEIKIYSSQAIEFEIDKIYDWDKKFQVKSLYDNINPIKINTTNDIYLKAKELQKYNIKTMDALHIVFAESQNIDYLLSTDRKMINSSKRANLKVKVINPIEFIMEVG